jgi:OmpA-OmpF porin, OOP family
MGIMKTALAVSLTAAGLVVTSGAMAQAQPDRGWYAGISLGQSDLKDACSGVPNCDKKDTAWKIFGGYQINPMFAAELGYSDLGKASASAAGVSASVEATAWELVGVGAFPINNQFSVFGKLGVYRAEVKGRSNVGVSADNTNSDLTFGAGVRYNFTRNIGVRAEWQRYSDVGGGSVGKGDIDVLSVGAIWKF